MTNEDAIKILEKMKAYMMLPLGPLLEGKSKDEEAVGIAIEALEKQIPMKPLPKELAEQQPFGNNPVYVIPCGCCGEPLNFLFPYCPWCGQAIDWTEGEE